MWIDLFYVDALICNMQRFIRSHSEAAKKGAFLSVGRVHIGGKQSDKRNAKIQSLLYPLFSGRSLEIINIGLTLHC